MSDWSVGDRVRLTTGEVGEVTEVLAGAVGVRITSEDSPRFRQVVHEHAQRLVSAEGV